MSKDLRQQVIGWGAALLVSVLGACSGSASTVGPGGGAGTTQTGGSCGAASACSGGVCATSGDFPAGYCTQGCTLGDPSTCQAGSVCIDDASGAPADAGIKALCYQSCATDADCTRAGYKCLEKASHKVCRNGA